jgi:hypothetical protein
MDQGDRRDLEVHGADADTLPAQPCEPVRRTLIEWHDLISKAIALYTEAADATRKGKAVGIAPTADVLETEFVGL